MTDAEERLALQPAIGRDEIAVRDIRHVVTVLFEEVAERELERQELARADRERVVDDAAELGIATVGPIKTDIGPRSLIPLGMRVDRRLVGPFVVGVPSVI